ncbi:MAG: hypothetical protein ACYDGR_04435 [Candidatus Dormibacteria bacterium]
MTPARDSQPDGGNRPRQAADRHASAEATTPEPGALHHHLEDRVFDDGDGTGYIGLETGYVDRTCEYPVETV